MFRDVDAGAGDKKVPVPASTTRRICHSICAMSETMTETSTQVVVFLYSHGAPSLRDFIFILSNE